jgi:hypothetical protein
MMKKLMLFVPLLILVSTVGANAVEIEHHGKQTYSLTCNEFNTSLEECKAHATKVCTNGHELVNHHEEVAADAGDGFYMHTKHHLVVRCAN